MLIQQHNFLPRPYFIPDNGGILGFPLLMRVYIYFFRKEMEQDPSFRGAFSLNLSINIVVGIIPSVVWNSNPLIILENTHENISFWVVQSAFFRMIFSTKLCPCDILVCHVEVEVSVSFGEECRGKHT